MDINNELKGFFENPLAGEYISCTDNLVRRSVTGISASCELLKEMTDRQGGKAEKELIDGIMTSCCELMRNVELSRVLAGGASGTEGEFTTVRLDSFLRDLAVSCGESTGGRCTVRTGELPASFVRTDREALSFLLLSFIRRHIIASETGEADFEIKCGENDKKVELKITASGTFVDFPDMARPDFFSAYHREVCMGLAERAGASAELSERALSVVIPLPDGNSPALLEAPAAEPERGFFNPFSLMLADI
ncbi:hypothetical protein [uncultured Ruminococcus sp.]|uniref:hypothetical protein n=1 Tax=uncultured Ruminococcus sp. TaxID=165186 RepID=UPI00260F9F02|nr:hypothetical protein [uncultured Ruminococcus sp.]